MVDNFEQIRNLLSFESDDEIHKNNPVNLYIP